MEVKIGSYLRSTLVDRFYIAGVAYHEAALVLEKIKAGDELQMVLEPNNPYDECAVALYFDDVMLGYIPRERNAMISNLAYFGHTKVFKARVMGVYPDKPTYKQLEVGIYIKPKKKRFE